MSQKEPNTEQHLLDALAHTWRKCPELRLTQLIVNVIGLDASTDDIFYTEDSKFIDLLERFSDEFLT